MNRNDDLMSRLLDCNATEQGSTPDLVLDFFVTSRKVLKYFLCNSSPILKGG